jgi:outer membrane receptor protein involved in Fe transport
VLRKIPQFCWLVLVLLAAPRFVLATQAETARDRLAVDQTRLAVHFRVLDLTGVPVGRATVEVPALGIGREADAAGRVTLELAAGEYTVRVRRVDHAPAERHLVVGLHMPAEIVVALAPRALRAATVVVSAARGVDPQPDQPGHYALDADNVTQQIAGLEDIMRSVQALPGVSRPSDYHGDFYVRGAGSHANAIYMDGIELYFPYHILGFNSVFNPGLIESAEFIAGGAPAEYGDATGGVLALRSRGATPSAEKGAVGLSYLSAHARYAWGDARRGGALSVRRSYQGDLLQWLGSSSGRLIPEFDDAFLRYRWQPAPGHQLVFGWLRAGDGLSLPRPEIEAGAYGILSTDGPESDAVLKQIAALHDQLELRDRLQVGSLVYRAVLGGHAYLETTLGYVPQSFDFSLLGDNHESVRIRSRTTTLRQDLTWRRPEHRLRAGWSWLRDDAVRHVSAWSGILTLRESNSSLNLVDLKERYEIDAARRRDDVALYVQDDWAAGARTTLGGGVRLEHDAWAGQTFLDPRATLDVRATEHLGLRWSSGVYHGLRDKPMEVLPSVDGKPLAAERSFETSFGASGDLSRELRMGASLYLKRIDAVVYEAAPAYYANGGEVQSRGCEMWLRYTPSTHPWRASLTYSWARTRELDPSAWRRLPNYHATNLDDFWRAIDEPAYAYRPAQDIPHQLGVEAWVHPGRWELGARYELASGRPYTPVRWVATDPLAIRYGVVGAKGSARYPLYQRLDLRVQRTLQRSGVRWVLYADVMNATAADNVFQYRYDSSYRTRYTVKMLPILPTAGFEAIF